MSFRGLSRVQTIINAWRTFEIALEVENAVTNGSVERAIRNYLRENQRPATIRVISDRGPIR